MSTFARSAVAWRGVGGGGGACPPPIILTGTFNLVSGHTLHAALHLGSIKRQNFLFMASTTRLLLQQRKIAGN